MAPMHGISSFKHHRTKTWDLQVSPPPPGRTPGFSAQSPEEEAGGVQRTCSRCPALGQSQTGVSGVISDAFTWRRPLPAL